MTNRKFRMSETNTNTNTTTSETSLLKLLLEPKPMLFASSDNAVSQWKQCWDSFLFEIPIMLKNNEEWFYYHRFVRRTMAGTDKQIQEEFKNLQKQGLKPCPNTEINNKKVYGIIPHPKKKKLGLRFDLSFHRFLGEEDKDGYTPGGGFDPLLWGIGVMGDGYTYMNVKFSEVELSKEQIEVSLNTINGKWKISKE